MARPKGSKLDRLRRKKVLLESRLVKAELELRRELQRIEKPITQLSLVSENDNYN